MIMVVVVVAAVVVVVAVLVVVVIVIVVVAVVVVVVVVVVVEISEDFLDILNVLALDASSRIHECHKNKILYDGGDVDVDVGVDADERGDVDLH